MESSKARNTITNLLNPTLVQYCLIGLCVLFATLYIWQINVSATHGYVIGDLQTSIDNIENENERLQFEVSRLQSVDSVTTRVQMLGLVKVQNIRYVKIGEDSVVAIRN